MNDHHIRTAFKQKVLARYKRDPQVVIVDELGLENGETRVDVAVINTVLHGFELKSDRDTLARLPHQMRIYSAVLDRVTLVVGYKHAYEALKIVPEWWGVKLADMGPRGAVYFSEARRPRPNPSLDPYSIAKLLWRNEALSLLEEFGEESGFRSKKRNIICAQVARVVDIDCLRARVREALVTRISQRVAV